MSIDQWLADPDGMRELHRQEHELRTAITMHLVFARHVEGVVCNECVELAAMAEAARERRAAAEALARLVKVYGVPA